MITNSTTVIFHGQHGKQFKKLWFTAPHNELIETKPRVKTTSLLCERKPPRNHRSIKTMKIYNTTDFCLRDLTTAKLVLDLIYIITERL